MFLWLSVRDGDDGMEVERVSVAPLHAVDWSLRSLFDFVHGVSDSRLYSSSIGTSALWLWLRPRSLRLGFILVSLATLGFRRFGMKPGAAW